MTSTQDGDLIINDKVIEVKYTKKGNATWLNTSIERFNTLYDFSKSYKDYMIQDGLYEILKNNLGEEVSPNTVSPITCGSRAKEIQKLPFYKSYEKKEKATRVKYVADIVKYFKDNPDKEKQFVLDTITKSICQKKMQTIYALFIMVILHLKF